MSDSSEAGGAGDRRHHRPMSRPVEFFDEFSDGANPELVAEAADRTARLLVRGARDSDDADVAERVLRLAETEGIQTLSEVWSGAPADSLAGALWRLYLLRELTHTQPRQVAAEYEAGRHHSNSAQVVAGVAVPPGPEQVKEMTDKVLRGIADSDFSDVLDRAAAFAHVLAIGRADLETPIEEVRRMLTLSEQLQEVAAAERRGELG